MPRKPVSAATSSAPRKQYAKKRAPKAAPSRKYRASRMQYPGAGAKIGSTLGSAIGPVGSLLGGAAGGLIHKLIHKVTGFGEYTLPSYTVTSNRLLETNDPPIVQNEGKEFVIRHREYLGDIYSGVAGSSGNPAPSPFKIQSFDINPGLVESFPWLANVAARFEEYRIEGMLFEYKSMYSDAAVQTGGSLGTVIMATSYNAAKPLFTSKLEMENYEFAQSAKPSVSMCHPIECARGSAPLSELYVRTSSQNVTGQDVKMYDFGKFQIASQGVPSTGSAQSLGECWVTYQIRFLKPRISDYLDSGYARIAQEPATQPAGSQPFAPNPAGWISRSDNIGVEIVDADTFKVPLRSSARTYMCLITIMDPSAGTSQGLALGYFTATSPSFVNGVLVSGLPTFNTITSTTVTGGVITSGSSYLFYFRTNALAPGATHCEVNLPNTGIGASGNLMKNLILNAVPASP